MPTIDDFLNEFPAESRQPIKALWNAVEPARQQELLALLPLLPNQPGKMRRLFALAHEQVQMSFGDKRQVAIVGPANVGKSTLYNQLIAEEADRAAVSPVPGTTRSNQSASAGPFTIIDTPGADAVGEVGRQERAQALAAAKSADFLVIIFDAVQGVKETEQALFQELEALHKPFIVVLNKMDLVKGEEGAVMARAARNLGIDPAQLIPVVAVQGENLEQVVAAIVKAEPGLVAALGQGLPAYRWQLAWRIISGSASTATLVALTPLPFVDFIPLVGIQASMILGIARIYEYRITPARARELIGVFGVGFLARTLFYEITKLGGPPGWMVAAGVAAGTTVALGYSAALWFERGEQLSRDATRQVAATVRDYLLESLKNLGKRRPSRRSLSERIRQALEKSPLPTPSQTGTSDRPPQET